MMLDMNNQLGVASPSRLMVQSAQEGLMLLQTVAEAARQLGLTTERIRQLTRAGTLQGVKTPYGYLYEPSEVLRLMRERKGAKRQSA